MKEILQVRLSIAEEFNIDIISDTVQYIDDIVDTIKEIREERKKIMDAANNKGKTVIKTDAYNSIMN